MLFELFNCYVKILSDKENNAVHIVVIPKHKHLIHIYQNLFETIFSDIKNDVSSLEDFKIFTDDSGITLSFIFKKGIDVDDARKRFVGAMVEILKRYTSMIA